MAINPLELLTHSQLTIPRSVLLACLATLMWSTPSVAQDRDARVLRAGELRIHFDAAFDRASDRFGSGGLEDLGADLGGPLTSESFNLLAPLQGSLDAFLSAAGRAPLPAPLSAGPLQTDLISSARVLPIGLSLGLLPRIEIGVELPIQREERNLLNLTLGDAEVGINSDTAAIIGLLSAVHASGAGLGAQQILPTGDSAAGQLLRQVVLEATGEELPLPDTPIAGFELADIYPVDPFPYAVTPWVLGDAEVQGRVQLFSSLGELSDPADGSGGIRIAASAALRLPTGVVPDTTLSFGLAPRRGAGGWRVGATADLFAGDRGWVTLGADWENVGSVTLNAYAPALNPGQLGIEAQPVDFGAQRKVQIAGIPRYRLTREISVGASASYERRAAWSIDSGATSAEMSANHRTTLGFVARYTTLPENENGGAVLPVEISGGYLTAVAGNGNALALRRAFISISLLPRIWGGAASASNRAE